MPLQRSPLLKALQAAMGASEEGGGVWSDGCFAIEYHRRILPVAVEAGVVQSSHQASGV